MNKLQENLADQDNFDTWGYVFICSVSFTLFFLVLFIYWVIYLKCFRVITLNIQTGQSTQYTSLPKLIYNLFQLIKYYSNLSRPPKPRKKSVSKNGKIIETDSDVETFVDRDVEIEEENDDITESRLNYTTVADGLDHAAQWTRFQENRFHQRSDSNKVPQIHVLHQEKVIVNNIRGAHGKSFGQQVLEAKQDIQSVNRVVSSGDNYDDMQTIPSMDTIQDLRNSLSHKQIGVQKEKGKRTSIVEFDSKTPKPVIARDIKLGENSAQKTKQKEEIPGLFSPDSHSKKTKSQYPSNNPAKMSKFKQNKKNNENHSPKDQENSDRKKFINRTSSGTINDLAYGQGFEKLEIQAKKHIRFASYFGQNLRRLTILQLSLMGIIGAQLIIVTASGAFVFPSPQEFIGYLKGDFLYKDYMGLVSMNCLIFGLLTFALSFVLFKKEFKNQELVYEQVLKNEVQKDDSSVQRKFLSPHVIFLSGLDKGINKYQIQEELSIFIDYNKRNDDSFSSESGSLILADKNSQQISEQEEQIGFGKPFQRSNAKTNREPQMDISVDRVIFAKSKDHESKLEDAGTKSLLASNHKPRSLRSPRFSDSENNEALPPRKKSSFRKSHKNSAFLDDQNFHEIGKQLRKEIAGNISSSFQSGGFNDSQMIHIPNKEFDPQDFEKDSYGLVYDRRMQILMLPDVEKLSELRRKIETLTRMHQYGRGGKLRCLLKSSERSRPKYYTQLAKLRDKYQDELQNIKFSGKALVYLKDLEDVKTLYSMNRLGKKFIRSIKYLRKKPQALKTSVALSKKTFLTDHKDFIFHNLKVSYNSHKFRKGFLYCLILAIFIFISTPNAVLQSVAELMKKDKLKKIGWNIDPEDAKIFSDIWINLVPLLTLGINALLLILLDFFAYWQKFPTHSACQKFIFRNSFIYMLINMLLIPGLSLSTANSIYKAFESRDFKLVSMLSSLKDKENDSFFSSLIVQSGIVGFLINTLLFSDLPNHRFILQITLNSRRTVNRENYYKTEMQAFQYGYYYASDCVIFFITAIFGIYQPVLYLSALIYFVFRFAGYFLAISTHYKNEFDSRGQLFNKFIAYIQFAVCLSFFVLSVKSIFVENWDYFLLNTALMVLFGLVALRNFKSFKIKDYCKMRNRFFTQGGLEANSAEDLDDLEDLEKHNSKIFDIQDLRAKAKLQRSVIKKFHHLFTDSVLKEVISIMKRRSRVAKTLGTSVFSSRTRDLGDRDTKSLRNRLGNDQTMNSTIENANPDSSFLVTSMHQNKKSLIVQQNKRLSSKTMRSGQDSLLKIISDRNVQNLMRKNPENSMLDASFASVNSFDVHFDDTVTMIDDIIAKKD